MWKPYAKPDQMNAKLHYLVRIHALDYICQTSCGASVSSQRAYTSNAKENLLSLLFT